MKGNIAYRVVSIKTTKFSFTEMEPDDIKKMLTKTEDIKLDINTEVVINDRKSTMSFSIHINVYKDKKSIIEHVGKTIFEIRGLNGLISDIKGEYNIPEELLIQLYALSYSHERALLATELSRTNFKDKFYLPVIDPHNFIKKDY